MKYIISSGTLVICTFLECENRVLTMTDKVKNAITYDYIGDAMEECGKINTLIGKPIFKVMAINS